MPKLATRPTRQTPGSSALWDWMERRALNQREAAKILGMHYMSLNQVLHGVRKPGLAVALRIEEHTGIPAGIWMRTQVSVTRKRKSNTAATADKQVGYRHAS